MSDTLIKLSSVTKSYQFQSERTAKELIQSLIGSKGKTRQYTALKKISTVMNRGETIGVIGKNGAGKSTLMKIIASVTYPTKGRVTVKGKVAPLIELGAGFHHELTGLENIYLNSAILGLHKREVELLIDKIIDFSELKDHINVPIKRYSSGMLIRLGFSIAVHSNAPILIFDEVLGVGDQAFQEKCFERIDAIKKTKQRLIIYVSHNEEAVRAFCERSLLLHQGELLYDGKTAIAYKHYHQVM